MIKLLVWVSIACEPTPGNMMVDGGIRWSEKGVEDFGLFINTNFFGGGYVQVLLERNFPVHINNPTLYRRISDV